MFEKLVLELLLTIIIVISDPEWENNNEFKDKLTNLMDLTNNYLRSIKSNSPNRTNLKIKPNETANQKVWRNFVCSLELPAKFYNPLMRWSDRFGLRPKSLLIRNDPHNLLSWFLIEIEKPDGGDTFLIRGFGVKGIEIVKARLKQLDDSHE